MKMHLALPVRDIQATVSFYSQLFQCEPSKRKADYAKFEPLHIELNIAFYTAREGELQTHQHLGLQLAALEQLDVEHSRLSRAGLVQKQREVSVCCYARQDKFWVTDPDGYEWELYVRLEDTEEKMAGSECCQSSVDSGDAQSGGCKQAVMRSSCGC